MDFNRGYVWENGEDMFVYSLALGCKLLMTIKPKVNIVKKRWVNLLPLKFK